VHVVTLNVMYHVTVTFVHVGVSVHVFDYTVICICEVIKVYVFKVHLL